MSDTNLFGRIVSPKMVERGVAAGISVWIDTYLAELERIDGYPPGAIERPRGVITTSEFAKWPGDQIPVLVVMNLGLAGRPERRAEGVYDTSWLIGIAPVVSALDFNTTRDLAGTYVAALRAGWLQHKMLKSPLYPAGIADHSVWHDESYGDIRFDESGSLGAGRVIVEVGVTGVVKEYAGPQSPTTTDPGPPIPVSESVVNVTPIGVGEAL